MIFCLYEKNYTVPPRFSIELFYIPMYNGIREFCIDFIDNKTRYFISAHQQGGGFDDARGLYQVSHQIPRLYAQGVRPADLHAVYDAPLNPQWLDWRRGDGQRPQDLPRPERPHRGTRSDIEHRPP